MKKPILQTISRHGYNRQLLNTLESQSVLLKKTTHKHGGSDLIIGVIVAGKLL